METRELQAILSHMMNEIHNFCEEKSIKYTLAYGTLLGAIRHKGFIPWDDDMDIFMLPADFLKFRSEFSKFNNSYFLQNKETEEKYYLIFDKVRLKGSNAYDKNYENFQIMEGIFIDIFPLYYVPSSFMSKISMLSKLQLLKYLNLIVVFNANGYKKQFVGKLAWLATRVISIPKLNRIMAKLQEHLLRYPPSNTVVDIELKPLRYLETRYFEETKKVNFEASEYYVPINSDSLLKIFYNDFMRLPDETNRETHDNFIVTIDEGVRENMFN